MAPLARDVKKKELAALPAAICRIILYIDGEFHGATDTRIECSHRRRLCNASVTRGLHLYLYCRRILIDAQLAANSFLIYRATMNGIVTWNICLSTPRFPRFNRNKRSAIVFFNQHWMENGTRRVLPYVLLLYYLSSE